MTRRVSTHVFFVFLLFAASMFTGCSEEKNPIPFLDAISPDTGVVHLQSFTLTARGSGFINSSRIVFNGQEVATTFVSSSQLTAEITAEMTIPSQAGGNVSSDSSDIPVQVTSPSPGGGTSGTVYYTARDEMTFSEPKNLTGQTDASERASIAVDDSNDIYIVYHYNSGSDQQIRFIRSTNGGNDFSSPVNLSYPGFYSYNPAIAAYGNGNVYVVWTTNTMKIRFQIFLSYSTDSGATFSEPLNISKSARAAARAHINVDGNGNVYVVWHDDQSYSHEIRLAKLADDGQSIQGRADVTSNGVTSLFPYVTFDNSNNVLLAWYQSTSAKYDIFFAKSTDGGMTFPNQQQLTANPYNTRFPKMAVDSVGTIHLLWQDDAPLLNQINRIYYTSSTDNETSFASGQTLTSDDYKSERPIPMIDEYDNLNVVYTSDRNGQFELFFIRSYDSGGSFSDAQRLTSADGAQFARAITGPDGTVYIAWHSRTAGEKDIYFCRSTD